jgi:hypothetical protein
MWFPGEPPTKPSTNHLEARIKTVGKDAYAKSQADVEQAPLSIAEDRPFRGRLCLHHGKSLESGFLRMRWALVHQVDGQRGYDRLVHATSREALPIYMHSKPRAALSIDLRIVATPKMVLLAI